MRIALLGGTGDIAEGLVLRWSKVGHKIFIGSRSDEKAKAITSECRETLSKLGINSAIEGIVNAEAALAAEVVVITLPYEHAASTIRQIKGSFTNQIVVSPVVPMVKKGKVFVYAPPSQGSAALEIKEALPNTVKLVSAYHNLPAKELRKIEHLLEYDVVICGDDEEAKGIVKKITEEMPNLRALDAGPLESSMMVEAITPLIINLNMRYKPQEFSVKFV
jgi:NADPH-dependent F420 reductase